MNRKERRHPFSLNRLSHQRTISQVCMCEIHIQGQIEAAFDETDRTTLSAQGSILQGSIFPRWEYQVFSMSDVDTLYHPMIVDGVLHTRSDGIIMPGVDLPGVVL